MKKIMVLLAVMAVFAASCVTFGTTHETAVKINRPGISYEAIGQKNVPSALSSANVDYSNGVLPAVAEQVKKNPLATVIVSSDEIDYFGDSNGHGGKQFGIFDNKAEYGIFVHIYKGQEQAEKTGFIIDGKQFQRFYLFPGGYHLKVFAGQGYATLVYEGDFRVDAIGDDSHSELADEICDFYRWYSP